MSIDSIDLSSFHQNFIIPKERKIKYSEINTHFSLIEKMMNQLPKELFMNPSLKWLDIGTGYGYYSMVLFKKLFHFLSNSIPNETERKRHILTNMIYMIELNEYHRENLEKVFGLDANIIIDDVLTHSFNETFDIIIGNPPYVSNGLKKVPTNQELNKEQDGKTIWKPIVKRALDLLKPNGFLSFIIPLLWLRCDKEHIHELILKYTILNCYCLTNTETNKIFHGQAQTPTCYFTLKKTLSPGIIYLYDKVTLNYVPYIYTLQECIPLLGPSIMNQLREIVNKYDNVKVIKTNTPSKKILFSPLKTKYYHYKNIKTCMLNKKQPQLVYNYSNEPTKYSGISKIILAHKMYGFPYYDKDGNYGLSTRDNYIILNKSEKDSYRLVNFLSSKLIFFVFEATRYRMKYLEKEAFLFIPDITLIPDFPNEITDYSIYNYFNLNEKERNFIEVLYRHDYGKLK